MANWQKIEEIFNATLALLPNERASFLDDTCAGDVELRQELDSLLKEVEEPDDFLSRSAFSTAAQLLSQEVEAPHLKTLGRYEIIRPIGRGGMGYVFLAQDSELERLVAIKLLPRSLATNSDNAIRFRQEARTASAISHPNIAHVYEFGKSENQLFLVMEYVEGKTLRDLLEKNALDIERALDIAIQVSIALQAAHEVGIVHRDIKPENVMIRRDGYVKVLDFGLAKLVDTKRKSDRRSSAPSLDATPGLIMGTTAYMSPEQVRGQPTDGRTDIWSLGVMLYEMVAGCRPFEGESRSDVREAVLLKEPEALPLTQLSAIQASQLREIIGRCLKKEKNIRYRLPQEITAALGQLQRDLSRPYRTSLPLASIDTDPGLYPNTNIFQRTANKSVSSAGIQTYRLPEMVHSKLLIVFALALLTSSLVLVPVLLRRSNKSNIATVPFAPNQKIQSLAIVPFDNETGDVNINFLTLGLADDLIRNIGRSRSLPVISLYSAQKVEKRIGYDAIAKLLQVSSLLEGKVRRVNEQLVIDTQLIDLRTGNAVWTDSLTAPEGDLLKLRNALALLLVNKLQENSDSPKRLVFAEYPTASNEAYRLYLKAKFDRSRSDVAEFRKLIKILEKAVSLDSNYTLAYVALAEDYNLLGTFLGQAPAYYQTKAKVTLEKALKLDGSLSEAHTLFAKIKMDYDRDWLGAEREFKQAIELDPNNELAHHWYGEVYLSAMKRLDESINELHIAHRLNPLASGILTGLAWSYIGKGDYEKAIAVCNQALIVNPDDTGIYEYRGKAFFKAGLFKEAVADAEKSCELDPKMARYIATLAVFYAGSGNDSEARRILTRLYTDKSLGEVSKYDLAIVHGALGQRDEAFRLLNEEVKSKSVDLLSIRIDPLLDKLRDDPRLTEVEREFHFPEANP